MKYILFFISSLMFLHFAYAENYKFDANNLTNLVVQNISGNVKINADSHTNKHTSVDIIKKDFDPKKCKVSIDNQSRILSIKVEEIGISSGNHCRVNIDINAPKLVELNLTNGSGNLDIQGLSEKLNFKIGSGDINANGSFDELNGNTGSGNVFIKGVRKGGTLRVGSGDVDLYFVQNTKDGKLNVFSGSGDITLFFPKQTTLNADFKSGIGQFKNQFQNDEKGLFKIFVQTGTGNLSINSN